MTRKRLGPMALLVGAIITICGFGAGMTWIASTQSQPAQHGKTLAEAISKPHGVANGDPLHAPHIESHKGVEGGADGVNQGKKKQAAAVQLTPDIHPVSPTQLFSKGDYTAGCTVGYGHGKACLPITPPSAGAMNMSVAQMPWTCAEARTLLPKGIQVDVKGVDPAHLDSNHDGIACGAGD